MAHSEAQNGGFGTVRVHVNVNGVEHTLTNVNAAKFADQLHDATDARPELLTSANAKAKQHVEQNLYRTLTGDFTR